jgi:hypothetical protein
MKKIRIFLLVILFTSICFTGFTQSASETNELGYILFTPDSTDFENYTEAKGLLDLYAKKINEISPKEKQIHIIGYTAIFENDIDPIKLSSDRANIVLQELISRGISSERFDIVKGNGGTNNWGNNAIAEDRKPNRRVTISIDIQKEIIAAPKDTKPETIEGSVPTNTVKQEKSAWANWWGKNWKTVVKVVIIIAAIIVAIILIVYFWPVIVAFSSTIASGAGLAAATAAAKAAMVAAKAAKAAKVVAKTAKIAKKTAKVVREGAKVVDKLKYRGGKYSDLDAIKGSIERHHMPPWNSFPQEMKNMKYGEVPAIQMDLADHVKTLGHSGRGINEISDLMGRGNYKEAVQRMVQDVKQLFPGKYDEAIKEFLVESEKYEEVFLQNLKNIKGGS